MLGAEGSNLQNLLENLLIFELVCASLHTLYLTLSLLNLNIPLFNLALQVTYLINKILLFLILLVLLVNLMLVLLL
jgi:hypothetical protein